MVKLSKDAEGKERADSGVVAIGRSSRPSEFQQSHR